MCFDRAEFCAGADSALSKLERGMAISFNRYSYSHYAIYLGKAFGYDWVIHYGKLGRECKYFESCSKISTIRIGGVSFPSSFSI